MWNKAHEDKDDVEEESSIMFNDSTRVIQTGQEHTHEVTFNNTGRSRTELATNEGQTGEDDQLIRRQVN